jgi:hypothetical protein
VKFRRAVESYNYASFGSAYAEWSRRGEIVRLVWDGKEQWLVVESTKSGDLMRPSPANTSAKLASAVDEVVAAARRAFVGVGP